MQFKYKTVRNMRGLINWVTTYYQADGVFSWIICFCIFLGFALTIGIDYSFGEFIGSVMHEFNANESDVAWIASVHTSTSFLAASLSSALGKKFSYGSVLLVGTIISCMAYALGAIYGSCVISIIILHGVLGGIGLIVAGIFVPEHRKWLIGGGLLMISLGVCFPLVMVVLMAFLGNQKRPRSSQPIF